MAYKKKFDECLYSDAVECTEHTKCGTCAWNPEVDGHRQYWRRVLGADRIILRNGVIDTKAMSKSVGTGDKR